jgi:hypothetical protein
LFVRQFPDYNQIPLDNPVVSPGPKVPERRAIKVLRHRPLTQVHYIQQCSSVFVAKLADSLPISLQSAPTLGPKRYKTAVESVTINVTDEFKPNQPSDPKRSFPPSVRHVDTSGRPQFSVSEERVIGLNESRAVFRDFADNGGFDDIPIPFIKLAKRLIWSYQRAISHKASARAILCNRGYSAGSLPTKLKPNIVRQVHNQYTYNWFLAEYMTLPPSRDRSERIRRNRSAKRAEWIRSMNDKNGPQGPQESEETGYESSHSIEFGCL